MKNSRLLKSLFGALVFVALALFSVFGRAADVGFNWSLTGLTNGVAYRLYYGAQGSTNAQTIDYPIGVTSAVVSNINPGVYWAYMRSYANSTNSDSGTNYVIQLVGDPSPMVNFVVPPNVGRFRITTGLIP